jgi:ribonucleotide reductase alpha subunit
VVNIVAAKYPQPTVENVQDTAEMVLQAAGEFEAAKHYILYRAEHAKIREEKAVPEEVKKAFEASDAYFPSPMQMFQFYDKYSRFNYDLARRETWIETVDRSVDFLKELSDSRLPSATYEKIRRFVLEMKSAPSMRLLAMAGPAARRQNIAVYNCSYMPVDHIDSFVEALIISMAWRRQCINTQTGKTSATPEAAKRELSVVIYDLDGTEKETWKLSGCFPTDLGKLELEAGKEDALTPDMKFSLDTAELA